MRPGPEQGQNRARTGPEDIEAGRRRAVCRPRGTRRELAPRLVMRGGPLCTMYTSKSIPDPVRRGPPTPVPRGVMYGHLSYRTCGPVPNFASGSQISNPRASSKGCKVYRASCSLSVASDSLARGPLALKPYGVRSSLHFIYALKRTAPSQTLCVFPVFFKLRSGITRDGHSTSQQVKL